MVKNFIFEHNQHIKLWYSKLIIDKTLEICDDLCRFVNIYTLEFIKYNFFFTTALQCTYLSF